MVRDHILAALRYWVIEMHVDGFRFDLASVLGRDGTGKLLSNRPLIERIAEDPILGGTELIAEAWDAAGAYEVGSFSERGWAEWNDRYRDELGRERNAENAGVISTDASRATVRVIRTDEEPMIAPSVCRTLGLGMGQ